MHEVGMRSELTVILLGSAVYMNAEGLLAGSIGKGEVKSLELGYRTPSTVPKITPEGFEQLLKQADDIISI